MVEKHTFFDRDNSIVFSYSFFKKKKYLLCGNVKVLKVLDGKGEWEDCRSEYIDSYGMVYKRDNQLLSRTFKFCHFLSDGELTEYEKYLNRQRCLSEYFKYNFDGKCVLLERRYYTESGKNAALKGRKIITDYDDKGLVKKIEYKNFDSKTSREFNFEYDDHGNLKSCRSNNNVCYTVEYEYDEKSRPCHIICHGFQPLEIESLLDDFSVFSQDTIGLEYDAFGKFVSGIRLPKTKLELDFSDVSKMFPIVTAEKIIKKTVVIPDLVIQKKMVVYEYMVPLFKKLIEERIVKKSLANHITVRVFGSDGVKYVKLSNLLLNFKNLSTDS